MEATRNACLKNIFHFTNERGNSFLQILILNGETEGVFALCQNCPEKSYLNLTNSRGQSALHLAVEMSQIYFDGIPMMQYLIDYGASKIIKDQKGNTPLHFACERELNDCVHILTRGEKMQDLEDKNANGFTCLHLAIMNDNEEIVKHLLQLKADVNAHDGMSGRTPLHHAIENQNLKILKLIADNGGNVRLTTSNAISSSQIANLTMKDEIIKFIEEMKKNQIVCQC